MGEAWKASGCVACGQVNKGMGQIEDATFEFLSLLIQEQHGLNRAIERLQGPARRRGVRQRILP